MVIKKVEDKVYVNVTGHAPDFVYERVGVTCPPQENDPNIIAVIAGEIILEGTPVKIGNDGKAYSCIEKVKS